MIITKFKIWLRYVIVLHKLNASKMRGYGKLETGELCPTVRKKLFGKGYEEYTQGGYMSAKRYFWTTSPVAKKAENK